MLDKNKKFLIMAIFSLTFLMQFIPIKSIDQENTIIITLVIALLINTISSVWYLYSTKKKPIDFAFIVLVLPIANWKGGTYIFMIMVNHLLILK